ncbi:MAG: APC family permease [Dehalococcoidia bacterium]|jgi:APA family basic amino acid/polyamine antiporter
MTEETQQGQGILRKELTLVLLIFLMIGLNIGGSLFTLTNVAAGLTGPSLIIAQIISALPVFLAIIPYMLLTSIAPKSAASYQYGKLASYPMAVAGVMVLLVAMPLGGLPLFAITNGRFIMMLFPDAPAMVPGLGISWVVLIALITITLFYIINIIGIKPAALVQFAMVFLLISALLAFIFGGLPQIEWSNFSNMFTGNLKFPGMAPALGQTVGLIAAAAICYTLLAGGLFGIELGDEVKKAGVTIPRGLLIAILGAFLLTWFVEIVAIGVMNWEQFAASKDLGAACKLIFGAGSFWFYFFIIGGAVMACISTVHAVMTIAGRYVMAYAKDGFFPKFMANINKQWGTPHWGLTLPWALSVIMLLLAGESLGIYGAMLNFGMLWMVTLVLIAAARLHKTHPEEYKLSQFKFKPGWVSFTAIAAAVLNVLFMLLLVVFLLMQKVTWPIILFVIAIIVGLGLYYIQKARKKVIPATLL